MPSPLPRLPLFPLRTVLLPHATLGLHVFEERYRRMIRSCLENVQPFGIVLIREGEEVGSIAEPYLVGTMARLKDVKTLDDGSFDVQVVGEGRFRVRQFDEEGEVLHGHIEAVYEDPLRHTNDAARLFSQVREEFESLVRRLFAKQDFEVNVRFPTDPYILSFTIANLLPMDPIQRQALLEITDTVDRMSELQPILRFHLLDAEPTGLAAVEADDLADFRNPN